MIGRREDRFLKAVTGLEGGVVASGSTCGVITGGALGLALAHEKVLEANGIAAEEALLSLVGDFVKWFQREYGSTHCRDRAGVNFYTTMGQLRYFLPGDRVGKCLWHIGTVANHLQPLCKKAFPEIELTQNTSSGKPIHCAQAVLENIRVRTGVGEPLLERLSFIFDGGIGLQGNTCGALVGAILGINLILGMDIHDTSYYQVLKAFTIGHMNLLLDRPLGKPEPFGVGKHIVNAFIAEAGVAECHTITGKTFSNWAEFQTHMLSSEKCAGLIELASAMASKAIQELM